jgi:spore germination cell wall hydrolase CwlJ-like protein
MLFSSRAANLAATFIALTTLAGLSVSSKALGADRDATLIPAIATTATSTTAINPSAPKPVPSIDPGNSATTSPNEVRAAAPTPAPGLQFASLAAAVAGQDLTDDADSELSCLAGAVYFESKGEPLSGQLAVANVIINRTNSGRFPSSICGVVKQPGQFSFVRGGTIPAIRSAAQYRTAMAIAQIAMDKEWDNPTPGALYFHARRVSPGWARPRVATIGNHIFFR